MSTLQAGFLHLRYLQVGEVGPLPQRVLCTAVTLVAKSMLPLQALRRVPPRPFYSSLALKRCFNSRRSTPLQSKILPLPSSTFLLVCAIGLGAYSLDARSAANEYLWCPLIRLLTDAEQGHKLGIDLLKSGVYPRLFSDIDDPVLEVDVFGKKLSNPIGMAAGFDKHGEVIDLSLIHI